ncbi:MAG: Maf family protein [Lachnospiraceae bacterium]
MLGKPADTDDADRMLSMLQGNAHSVFTGVTLIRRGLKETWQVTFAEETRVHMYPMTEAEIRWYVAQGEPMDGCGRLMESRVMRPFVEKIEGDYNNAKRFGPAGREKSGRSWLKKMQIIAERRNSGWN